MSVWQGYKSVVSGDIGAWVPTWLPQCTGGLDRLAPSPTMHTLRESGMTRQEFCAQILLDIGKMQFCDWICIKVNPWYSLESFSEVILLVENIQSDIGWSEVLCQHDPNLMISYMFSMISNGDI